MTHSRIETRSRVATLGWVLSVTIALGLLGHWTLRVLCLFLYGHPIIANLLAGLCLSVAAVLTIASLPRVSEWLVAHSTLLLAVVTSMLVFFFYPDLRDDSGLPNLVRPFLFAFWGTAVTTYCVAFLMKRSRARGHDRTGPGLNPPQ